MRAVVIVDGEHHPSVVRDALAELEHEVVAAVLAGGTEKLRGGEGYGVPLEPDLGSALARHGPDVVLDLSDEPVLGPAERMRLASRALALGVPYLGADFRFDPPRYEPFELPALAVIATGKRAGKTAVTGRLVRLLADERRVVVVAMGRGGPPEPELVESPPSLDDLLRLSRSGRHAASDHLETAVLAGALTIGCRRCGGGLAGAVASSNVSAGARLAAKLAPDLVVFDGSGAAIPPVAVGARILVADGRRGIGEGLNAYRVLVADLVVQTGGDERLREEVRAVKEVPVVRAQVVLRPVEPLAGRRTAVFTAGAVPTEGLDAEVVHVSRNLSDPAALAAELERIDADVYLTELKGAAVDVVAETALARGVQVVFAANDLVPCPGEPDLDDALRAVAEVAGGARAEPPPLSLAPRSPKMSAARGGR